MPEDFTVSTALARTFAAALGIDTTNVAEAMIEMPADDAPSITVRRILTDAEVTRLNNVGAKALETQTYYE